MSVINAIPMLLGGEGYEISRSVRLRSSASAYFNRTPAVAGNRKTWTWSGWVKRGALGSAQILMSSDVGTSNTTWIEFGFDAADTFTITAYATDSNTTSAVFRDPSAWYHVVVAFDSTQATAANRCKIYINGTQQTLTGAGFTLNADYGINNNQIHGIGYRNWASGVGRYFDGYLTEVNFIDGQALTPSSFGETDAVTGVWKPKKYAGTYGTNGFYLNFSDNSAATAAAIGKDNSGNGNNWTPNNISVTSGVTYDSMIDSPTMYADGGNGRGNYCVLNPIKSNSSTSTYQNGNLQVTFPSGSAGGIATGTMAVSSGKWYWEITVGGTDGATQPKLGIISPTVATETASSIDVGGLGYAYGRNGNKSILGSVSAYGATFTTNDVIGFALDLDAGTLTCYKNNSSQGTLVSGLSGEFTPALTAYNGYTQTANFGQRPFAYTPPTGFKALNTQNLPDATIKKGGSYFNAVTYTGNGATGQTISGAGFQPDLVWVKSRSAATDNGLQDAVRGVTKDLNSNNTDAEETRASSITAFTSDGFTLGGNDGVYNTSAATYVAWQWKESVSAGFDIVTYTGTGANRTVAHSLGVAPSMLILKQRNAVDFWVAWHSALANTEYLLLNSTNAKATAATYWNSTSPTSSVFSLGTDSRPNGSGTTYVAYLFAEVAGFSKFGSYTGNGSADGPFVYLGFRPRWVLVKRADSTGDWNLHDTSRDTYNVADKSLFPNASNAETTPYYMDILSNGFKIKDSGSSMNTSSGTYIYAAFAENPFKNSLAR